MTSFLGYRALEQDVRQDEKVIIAETVTPKDTKTLFQWSNMADVLFERFSYELVRPLFLAILHWAK